LYGLRSHINFVRQRVRIALAPPAATPQGSAGDGV
jgi:hypothetical protein